MYKSFNVSIDSDDFNDFLHAGQELHKNNKRIVCDTLDGFKGDDDKLVASKIVAEWFPEVQADVFLSHSHKDENSVIALSGWLKEEFGLTSFIDSCIWGYSEKLLKMIDDQYCYDKKNEIYNYNKRNRSTSHVYMMLSTALTGMIDRCEVVFFVNTPNSFSADNYIESHGTTESPWIYSELAMTRLVRTKKPEQHRQSYMIAEARDSMENYKDLNVEYHADLSHLIPLSKFDLTSWWHANSETGSKSLDALYKQAVIYRG
ncbi:hypothetical protein [Pseudomonas protegens]|uniref:hypothetical protein n=1 Tax=Pseudomonas protegens TaxID=380021 RepID=UPI00274CB844|nr:hypothetical protein [Pseudomonas protegens]MDP9514742.1 hypothetical protein [Pseudomonas protegens]